MIIRVETATIKGHMMHLEIKIYTRHNSYGCANGGDGGGANIETVN